MTLTFAPVSGIGEIVAGDDLATIIARAVQLRSRDVVVVTSKVISKAAGLTTTRDKADVLQQQTDRIVAQRGDTQIVRTHHGLTMAAAGIDASNTAPGTVIPLPDDPDASARELRARIAEVAEVDVAVIISDTAGRAWRHGQTDIAIGCAGLTPIESFAGRTDPYGNPLAVTAPAIADELAGAAELASGKMGGLPVVVVRGTPAAWHLTDDGPGATALVREESADMFGLGAREAAVAAVLGRTPVRGLPHDPVMTTQDLADLALRDLAVDRSDVVVDQDRVTLANRLGSTFDGGVLAQRLVSLGVAHGMPVRVEIGSDER